MRLALKPHPAFLSNSVLGVEVGVSQTAEENWALRYRLTGAIPNLLLPPPAVPARRDDLWQHTCFELFIRTSPQASYFEFNFSPSTQWAGYEFSDYRRRTNSLLEMKAPSIETASNKDAFELRTELDLSQIAALARGPVWQLGLSAVIEETSGHKSYWALAHPAGKPDFHHSDCFALEVAAAERS